MATRGRVFIFIDEDQLSAAERKRYDQANKLLIDSMLDAKRPQIPWPLDR